MVGCRSAPKNRHAKPGALLPKPPDIHGKMITLHAHHVLPHIMQTNWLILIVAGLFESGFAFCLGKMKDATGVEWYLWGAGFLLSLALSMLLLGKAVQTLPIGTAYPVWTGIGAFGTVVLGIAFLHEPATFARLFFVTTLIASVIGLKMT